MYPARGNWQARGQIEADESSVGEPEGKDDAIEVSSSHSEESFHTATRSPMPEFISTESRGVQGSRFARIRQAQERRTGSVKREEEEEGRRNGNSI